MPTTDSRPSSRTRAASSSASAKVGSPGPLTARSRRRPALSAPASAAMTRACSATGSSTTTSALVASSAASASRSSAIVPSPKAIFTGSCDLKDVTGGVIGFLIAFVLRAVAPRFGDQRLEEALVLFHLRMPEDPDGKPTVWVLQALERPVPGPGRLDEPLSHASHTLVVARLHGVVARADDFRKPRSALHLDRVLGERAEHLAMALVADRVRQVLVEVAAA